MRPKRPQKSYEAVDFEQIINAMGAYNESLMKAGVLLAGEGLAEDLSEAFVVDFSAESPIVTDGPYGETHELFNGFWIIQDRQQRGSRPMGEQVPLGPRQQARGAPRDRSERFRRLFRQ